MNRLILFTANWCSPCSTMSLVVQETKLYFNDYYTYEIINVDNDPDMLAEKYVVRSLPTVLLLDPAGKELDRKVGLTSYTRFTQWLESMTPRYVSGIIPRSGTMSRMFDGLLELKYLVTKTTVKINKKGT